MLAIGAAIFFVAHVLLLFTSFGKADYNRKKYLWSHLTLWICGILLFSAALLYAGKGVSPIIDVFDTPVKQWLILVVVLVLSAAAHTIVKLLVMPKYQGR
ncbi:hypothetical protein EG028_07790 [Chitinophaga barathri]|uniref:Uncharacterized protein n=1 Tax=Chitinophaga barathri TaxID=1647451 RepID=A0A3N4MDT5_9BACT|nr:hypothetical protein EG028_07790 [Chitinophaga barathri]